MRISDWSSDGCSSDLNRLAGAVGDQDAVAPALDRALVGAVAVEQAVHDAGAAGVCEELAVIADEAARRRPEGDAGLAAAGGPHVDQLGLAQAHLLHHHAAVLLSTSTWTSSIGSR